MTLLSESPTVLPIHRKILAFSFIGWIFDFYDLLLLTFLISPSVTSIVKDLALTPEQIAILLGTPLAFTAVGGFIGGAMADRFGRKPLLIATILVYSIGTLAAGLSVGLLVAARGARGHRHRRRRRVGGRARAGRRNGAARRPRPLRLLPAERLGVRTILCLDDGQHPRAGDRVASRVHALRAAGAAGRVHPPRDARIGRVAGQREGRREQASRLRRRARPDARAGAAQDDRAGAVGDDVQHGGVLVQNDLAADLSAADAQPEAGPGGDAA